MHAKPILQNRSKGGIVYNKHTYAWELPGRVVQQHSTVFMPAIAGAGP